MPRKKDGMLFEVHPTPIKGKDGQNIVYARPVPMDKFTMKGLEDYCHRNYHSYYGEIGRAFDYFLRAAGELMAMGYRIETPIGSFAPKRRTRIFPWQLHKNPINLMKIEKTYIFPFIILIISVLDYVGLQN